MTLEPCQAQDRSMQLNSTLAFLVDAAAETRGADLLLSKLGAHLIEDGVKLAGGALTLAAPHPLIAQRTWLWRADSGEVIEALGFAPAGLAAAGAASQPGGPGRTALRSAGSDRGHSPATRRTASARPRASRRPRSLR